MCVIKTGGCEISLKYAFTNLQCKELQTFYIHTLVNYRHT